MAFEIEIHALAKGVVPDEHHQHADDFGAFFIDRGSVEIIDFNIAVWPHRVRHGAGIFRELRLTQRPNIFNALHCTPTWRANHVC